MSPSDFGKAWDRRNERLRDGGVFEYVTNLTDAHGRDVIEKMTASELIRAVADLGLKPSSESNLDNPARGGGFHIATCLAVETGASFETDESEAKAGREARPCARC